MVDYNKFRYFPVSPKFDKKAFIAETNYFDNATIPIPDRILKHIQSKPTFIDSGGLQIFKALDDGKIVMVGPMFKTEIDDNKFFILGTIDQLNEYRRRKSNRGMVIDFPTKTEDPDAIYYWKLTESIKARNYMLKLADCLAPDTRLGIVLQPRKPLEIENYYCSICTSRINIYAYPVRNFRNRPRNALGNAHVLSFLHSMGVQHVHFLGSNAPVVVYILAKATALGMFELVSFDSATWNQKIKAGVKYLHPETLSIMPQGEKLHPKANLSRILSNYPDLYAKIQKELNPPPWMIAEEWIGICNIKIIEYFKDQVLGCAIEGRLEEFILQTKKYTQNQKIQIIEAIHLLDESKLRGHEYIKQKYRI